MSYTLYISISGRRARRQDFVRVSRWFPCAGEFGNGLLQPLAIQCGSPSSKCGLSTSRASPESLLEIQDLRPYSALLNQNQHFNKLPVIFLLINVWETLRLLLLCLCRRRLLHQIVCLPILLTQSCLSRETSLSFLPYTQAILLSHPLFTFIIYLLFQLTVIVGLANSLLGRFWTNSDRDDIASRYSFSVWWIEWLRQKSVRRDSQV